MKKLTDKWLQFVAVYDGNIRRAAEVAGLSYSYARRIIATDETVAQAIRERNVDSVSEEIATREDRQRFWSEIMNDSDCDMKDRLRASELLGRSEKDFVERVESSGPDGKPIETNWTVEITRAKDTNS